MASLIFHPVVVNARSLDLGGFLEVVSPAALERTLREKIDVRALVAHDTTRPLGRLSAKTLALATDSRGLRATVDMPPTSYARDAAISIARGDAPGASFAFSVLEDAWTMTADGAPLRTLLDMRISEVSAAVTFCAYPATEAASRYGRAPDVEDRGAGLADREFARTFSAAFRAIARRHADLASVRVSYAGAAPTYRVILKGEEDYRPSLDLYRRRLLLMKASM